jgi:hypothetical protein
VRGEGKGIRIGCIAKDGRLPRVAPIICHGPLEAVPSSLVVDRASHSSLLVGHPTVTRGVFSTRNRDEAGSEQIKMPMTKSRSETKLNSLGKKSRLSE